MEPWQRTNAATKVWSSADRRASGGTSKRPSIATSSPVRRTRSMSNGAPPVRRLRLCQSCVAMAEHSYLTQYLIKSILKLIKLSVGRFGFALVTTAHSVLRGPQMGRKRTESERLKGEP